MASACIPAALACAISRLAVRRAIHNDKGVKNYRLYAPVFNRGATVQTVEGFPQFLVYDRTALTLSPMTEENMNTEKYDTTPKPTGRFDRLIAFFQHLISADTLRQSEKKSPA